MTGQNLRCFIFSTYSCNEKKTKNYKKTFCLQIQLNLVQSIYRDILNRVVTHVEKSRKKTYFELFNHFNLKMSIIKREICYRDVILLYIMLFTGSYTL